MMKSPLEAVKSAPHDVKVIGAVALSMVVAAPFLARGVITGAPTGNELKAFEMHNAAAAKAKSNPYSEQIRSMPIVGPNDANKLPDYLKVKAH